MKATMILLLLLCAYPYLRCCGEVDYEKLYIQVTYQSIKRIGKETGLLCVGRGGGAIGMVRELSLSFQSKCPNTIEEARRLAITAMEMYCHDLNHSKTVRPYFIVYPFPRTRLEIKICFVNKDESSIKPGHLAYVAARHGSLFYYQYLDDYHFPLQHQETYEEGVAILAKMATSSLTTKEASHE